MICPLLAKHKLERPECDFPELCTPTRCQWARFHEVDAQTGKPATGEKQTDLFDEAARD